MSTNTKLKKLNKLSNPIMLNNRISVFYKLERGVTPYPNEPSPLDPKKLTRSQQNVLIEHLRFYQSMLIFEIADYLKLARQTVSKRCTIKGELGNLGSRAVGR